MAQQSWLGVLAVRNDFQVKTPSDMVVTVRTLDGGETDVFMGSGIGTLNAVARGIPVVAIAAPLQFDLQCLVVRPEINKIEDLKGHKILVTAGGQSGYWLWLKRRYGFTDDQVAPYTGNFQPFVQDASLALGGIATSEPFRAKQAGVDNKYILLAKNGFPPYGGPLVAMKPYLDANSDAIARFVKATLQGWKSFMMDPDPGIALIQKLNPQADDGWMKYSVSTMKELNVVGDGDAATSGIGTMTSDRWRQLAEFMSDVNLVKPDIDWRSAYTSKYVDGLNIML